MLSISGPRGLLSLPETLSVIFSPHTPDGNHPLLLLTMVYIVFCCLLLRLSLHPGLQDRNLQLSPRPTAGKRAKRRRGFFFFFLLFSPLSLVVMMKDTTSFARWKRRRKRQKLYIYIVLLLLGWKRWVLNQVESAQLRKGSVIVIVWPFRPFYSPPPGSIYLEELSTLFIGVGQFFLSFYCISVIFIDLSLGMRLLKNYFWRCRGGRVDRTTRRVWFMCYYFFRTTVLLLLYSGLAASSRLETFLRLAL